jgi:ABC-2 type transport system ATP-binding protein
MSIIKVENISKTYKNETVLNDISLNFEKGKIHGIIGKNGSGKTLLFKVICGYVRPTKGSVTVNNKKIGIDCDFADNIGVILEVPGFLPYYSGYKNLNSLASIKKIISKDKIFDAMNKVGLDPNSKKPVGKYSLGMNQRLGIAQAIMEDPDILILDEPFNSLDKQGVIDIKKLLMDFRNEGKTLLISSHHQIDIDELCDTVHEMDSGNLINMNK